MHVHVLLVLVGAMAMSVSAGAETAYVCGEAGLSVGDVLRFINTENSSICDCTAQDTCGTVGHPLNDCLKFAVLDGCGGDSTGVDWFRAWDNFWKCQGTNCDACWYAGCGTPLGCCRHGEQWEIVEKTDLGSVACSELEECE
ncbi:MAG: hypothetical protein GF330_10765 [Candidatus Eisenbacteria bacterium]|nr:hypothetical protein [Candidatus Eisenbacteria bacterium]